MSEIAFVMKGRRQRIKLVSRKKKEELQKQQDVGNWECEGGVMKHRSDLTNMAIPKKGPGMKQGRKECGGQSDPEDSMPMKDI